MKCSICNQEGALSGTKLCNKCWELKTRIEHNLKLAEQIIKIVKSEIGVKSYLSTKCPYCKKSIFITTNIIHKDELLFHANDAPIEEGRDLHNKKIPCTHCKKIISLKAEIYPAYIWVERVGSNES